MITGRQWIYEYLRTDRKRGGDLCKCPRRRGKKPCWKGGRHSGPGHIPDRVDISERPEMVEKMGRIGDWEANTIIEAGHRSAIVSLVDRASKFALPEPVEQRTAGLVGGMMCKLLAPFRDQVQTIAADNVKEFADHKRIAGDLEATFYFATPYHSWKRGLNEHANGQVRKTFLKGTDFRGFLGCRPLEQTPPQGARLPDARRGVRIDEPDAMPVCRRPILVCPPSPYSFCNFRPSSPPGSS